ncbi:OCIA domain-containing protein 1 [Xenopus tropicalis]|uniref:OCIA domain-containing protein 1 n=1 Tax=Xenopus tropicalis TaxID=8364 RepID=OCAD1_XENTR|nr:OCIA domain-containing protein 1 [Xenopus tropicalis]Q28GQ3.1 RecName: Full=OCIA domain-containing protein 1 [Xenopus tropicalis]CAJ83710.1 novel protein similar to ovarian carcinoma immunoreactive antigen (OCIA) [Xenopus tropicalis]|eukprot:NP_001039167.1 OCIA domain-containing protein 1 [Xenopus tropicalis]
MAPSPAEFSDQQQPAPHRTVQPPGVGYIPTDDERRVFRECNEESFWYRSLPISAVSMIVTQGLISRGILTTSSRFGSLPKVAFAGLCGYLAGKVSYMKTCQEKFKRLENSPLGEALRQGYRNIPTQYPSGTSEFSDVNPKTASPADGFASNVVEPPSSVYSSHHNSTSDTVPFSTSLGESSPSGISDNIAPEPAALLEDTPKRKPMTYDELRSRNRETYEMAVTQRADAPVRSSLDRAARKDVKTNKYGDVWEE